jgi:hypothetical protein
LLRLTVEKTITHRGLVDELVEIPANSAKRSTSYPDLRNVSSASVTLLLAELDQVAKALLNTERESATRGFI